MRLRATDRAVSRWTAGLACAVAATTLAAGSPAVATPVPTAPTLPVAGPSGHQLPFRCGHAWTGTTRGSHSPSVHAIDFNRPADLGRVVLASAPGTVVRVEDAGSRSYGKWVQVLHPDGYSSLYAHLKAQWVVLGQRVDQGTILGRVGSSGRASGPHLHYEQRLASKVVAVVFASVPFARGATLASANCGDVPLAGDWDGDGVDEVGVFRRQAAGGTFRMQGAGTASSVRLGRPTDLPVVGDWDGDGTSDVGVRRQSTRRFILRGADGRLTRTRLGEVRDLPVVGDWDGDGTTDLGVWRPRAAQFRLLQGGRQRVVRMGTAASQPVTGDWDGDGTTDLGVFDPASASFRLRTVAASGVVNEVVVPLGTPTDLPVTGDWDGNGRTDVGTWTPATATFTLRSERPNARRLAARLKVRSLVYGRRR